MPELLTCGGYWRQFFEIYVRQVEFLGGCIDKLGVLVACRPMVSILCFEDGRK